MAKIKVLVWALLYARSVNSKCTIYALLDGYCEYIDDVMKRTETFSRV
jgi:hypothetical protein